MMHASTPSLHRESTDSLIPFILWSYNFRDFCILLVVAKILDSLKIN